jgi:hypothetical protein
MKKSPSIESGAPARESQPFARSIIFHWQHGGRLLCNHRSFARLGFSTGLRGVQSVNLIKQKLMAIIGQSGLVGNEAANEREFEAEALRQPGIKKLDTRG